MRLYGDFTSEDWKRVSRLSVVPETVILHGEDSHVIENLENWEGVFDAITARPRWNMIIGNKGTHHIGFANVCWAPMAALIVHRFAMLGTKRFIQVGYCGGLKKHLRYGDILVVSHARGEDGVSTSYVPGKIKFDAHPNLVSRAVEILETDKYPYQIGQIVSTSSMFLETAESVKKWARAGLTAVDGETAAVFAVAMRFGAEAVSLLTCSDNMALNENLWEKSLEAQRLEDVAIEKIHEMALKMSF